MNRTDYLRPSGAATWTVCSGYLEMRTRYPDEPDEADTDIREDGTACHWLAYETWHGRTPALGSLSPNNRELTEGMFDAVDEYIDMLRSPAWGYGETHLEMPVDCGIIYPGMKGTPDAHTLIRPNEDTNGRLRVVDLKFGFRFVEVWDNLQLIIYALALAAHYKLADDFLVELTIFQPRTYHRDGARRSWTTTIGALRSKWLEWLRERADKAMSYLPPCTANPGCWDCPARHACPTLQQAAYTVLHESYSSVPLELTPAAAGDELRRLKEAQKLLEARITGVTAQVESMLRTGATVPHWALAASYARERWREGTESQVLTLGRYYNADLAKPPQPITPAQARKKLPPGLVELYSHKPSTGVKLVKQDGNEARKVFDK